MNEDLAADNDARQLWWAFFALVITIAIATPVVFFITEALLNWVDSFPMKINLAFDSTGKRDGWVIQCPACGARHHLDHRWYWNDSFDKPSFRPPFNLRTGSDDGGINVCHSVITNGMIAFQPDCTHALRGKTVPLPDIACGEPVEPES